MKSYILIDKVEKQGFTGKDMRAISKASGVSENTIKSWKKKGDYWETLQYIFFYANVVIGKKGGDRRK